MADYEYISWDRFSPKKIEKKYLPHAKDKPAKAFCRGYMTLDTETSKNEYIGWVYQWALGYPQGNKRAIVYGRRPSELAEVLERIHDVNQLGENTRLICFVHNLSYDYTYISRHIEQRFGQRGNILAVGAHRLISYNIDGLEMRDSLKIALKSLASWGKELNIKHGKLVGEIDYNVVRYQDSPLCIKDWRYMFRDIISLDECIEKQLQVWEDEIWTMPLTNTGYVRRETRKLFKKDKKNRTAFESRKLNLTTYKMCRREFAGGITHGNRFYMNMTVDIEDLKQKMGRDDIIIRHRDFASHYPSQQITKYAPSTKFCLYYDAEKTIEPFTKDELKTLENDGRCYLASIIIGNLHIKNGVTLPVAQECKFKEGELQKNKYVSDNGRILHMDGVSLVVVNELDIKWLEKQYTFDYKIEQVYVATRGQFPGFLQQAVNEFFYQKSFYKAECKRIEKEKGKESVEYREMALKLQIAKGMLNGIYGMTATDPIRVMIEEGDDGIWTKEKLSDDDIAEKLEKYYNGKNNFMNYELGLWTTAHARDELLFFVELIGYENFLYADTDSIFYISTPEIEDRINAVNKQFRDECEANGWFIEVNGKKSYYHQFEDEEENIVKFRFLHSKCYAYVTDNEELNATIAGVRKYGKDNYSRTKELGSIDELRHGKIFEKCGGTITKYPGKGYDISPNIKIINGHETEVANWAMIENSTKELHSVGQAGETIINWGTVNCYD